ncbi:glycosyltransferase family 2 protein [Maridesulfovibrio bastinii]|uniref:glycosyltransferase family 2 protein n=1 Tax=Maridesulfovibrio bastinii TaxID=47157 RepID=UPI00041AE4FF|nr:glycosyltransferase family 2 protein [Maridesulfovibrio bastinii]
MTGSFWNLLDSASRYRLLVSGHGKQHLLETASRILSLAGTGGDKGQLLDIGIDVMLTAWEDSPFDGQLAANLLNINSRLSFLPDIYKLIMEIVVSNYNIPANINYFQKLAAEKDTEKLISYLEKQLENDSGNFFWLGHYLDITLFAGQFETPSILDEMALPEIMKPVVNKYKGDFAFCSADFEKSIDIWSDAKRKSIPGQTLLRIAEALFRTGKFEEARRIWRERMTTRPWQVNTWLSAYDRIMTPTPENSAIEGRIALCLYTYNKADDLEFALKSVAESPLENLKIVALSNGCTDSTSSVLSAWKEKLGNRLEIVGLPVNVGAPAARNWLKHHPAIGSCDYVAYLDDDAVLPENWQGLMADAIAKYPDAGVWGCKVADFGREEIIQHADIHLRESFEVKDNLLQGFSFSYFESFNQDMDYGQYDYCRPCTSVTGCFHLFRRDVLEFSDDFDLRFSPSQYDDFDHDLSLQKKGQQVVYNGLLKVLHRRRSGNSVKLSREARGAGAGNVMKLEAKYSARTIEEIIENDINNLESDFSEKSVKLASFLDS